MEIFGESNSEYVVLLRVSLIHEYAETDMEKWKVFRQQIYIFKFPPK